LRLLRLRGGELADSPGVLGSAVDEVRCRHRGVRFSVQPELEERGLPSSPGSVAVLGPNLAVQAACAELDAALPSGLEEAAVEHFFALHFTMREAWDLPQDDELMDASIDHDWVDLGGATEESAAAEDQTATAQPTVAVSATAAAPAPPKSPSSPAAVMRGRLREVVTSSQDLQLFMDENPFASWGQDAVRVDLVGPLSAEAWQAATRAVLACEAHRVYLSRRYDAVFWCPKNSRELIENQVAGALSHWKGSRTTLGDSGGVGLSGGGFTGFEDLAANVGAVLRGVEPPGWHRLEWTPHGDGAVPLLTY